MRPGGALAGWLRDGGAVGVEVDDAGVVGGQPVAQRGLRDQEARAGVCQHEGEAVFWVIRIERQVGGAGLEDTEERDHHVEGALDAQPDDGLGPDAERAQVMGELVGALIERRGSSASASSQTSATASGVRAACWANSSGMVASGIGARGVVPVGQDGAALGRRENVEAADGAGRAPAAAAVSSRARRSRQRGGRCLLEQVAGIFQHPVDAGGCAVGGALLGERERQVELGAGDRHLLEGWCAVPAARGSPGRRSGTPASPGTADDATASAPG